MFRVLGVYNFAKSIKKLKMVLLIYNKFNIDAVNDEFGEAYAMCGMWS